MERISQVLLTCLLNACWQIALITSVAAFCAWLLRETAARYRHLLWVAALALCFCLPVLTSYQVSRGASIKVQPEPQTTVQEAIVSSTQIPLDIQTSPEETGSLVPVSRNLATGLVAIYLLFLGYRAMGLFKAWRLTRAIARSVSRIELPETSPNNHRALPNCARSETCGDFLLGCGSNADYSGQSKPARHSAGAVAA